MFLVCSLAWAAIALTNRACLWCSCFGVQWFSRIWASAQHSHVHGRCTFLPDSSSARRKWENRDFQSGLPGHSQHLPCLWSPQRRGTDSHYLLWTHRWDCLESEKVQLALWTKCHPTQRCLHSWESSLQLGLSILEAMNSLNIWVTSSINWYWRMLRKHFSHSHNMFPTVYCRKYTFYTWWCVASKAFSSYPLVEMASSIYLGIIGSITTQCLVSIVERM